MKLLLNADCGEWEAPALTAALLPLLDLANLACGGHAGTPESLARIAALAAELPVRLGAHPGLPGDGRQPVTGLNPTAFRDLIECQLATFRAHAGEPFHLKLHGVLYHLSERDPKVRNILVDLCHREKLLLVALAGGEVAATARAAGVEVCEEAFLDRGYRRDGSLVPRGEPGDLLEPGDEVNERLRALTAGEPLRSIDGGEVPIRPDTLCVHADSPASLALVERARQILAPS